MTKSATLSSGIAVAAPLTIALCATSTAAHIFAAAYIVAAYLAITTTRRGRRFARQQYRAAIELERMFN